LIYTGKDEIIKDIKGVTYYIEEGKQKSISLSKEQIFTTEINKGC